MNCKYFEEGKCRKAACNRLVFEDDPHGILCGSTEMFCGLNAKAGALETYEHIGTFQIEGKSCKIIYKNGKVDEYELEA